jgi:hypothetical protein
MGGKLIQDWAQGSAARECFNSKTLVMFKELEKENYFSKMVNQWVKDRSRLHKTIASKPERAEDTAYIECLKSWIRNEHLIKKDWTEEPLLPTLFIEVEQEILRQEVSWANLPSNGNIVRL